MYRVSCSTGMRIGWLMVFALACSALAGAQVTFGDYLHMRMDGSLGYGYSSSFGSFGSSSHGSGFGFDGQLKGYYFDPRFISFDMREYYDRSQANSDIQTINRGSGLSASAGFFSNTHFPGSITFGKDFGSDSQFQIAGVPSLVGRTTGQSEGISWSVLLPHKPTLNLSYSMGGSDSTISGTDIDSTSATKTFTASSSYKLAGWAMFGGFNNFHNHFSTPEFITGSRLERSGSSSNYTFSTDHRIPLNGSINFGVSHSNSSDSDNDNAGSTSYSVGAGVTPFSRWSVSGSYSYSTNASESAIQQLLGTGAVGLVRLTRGANAMFTSAGSSFNVGHGLMINGIVTHREEDFGALGHTSDTQYGGTASYRFQQRFLKSFYVSAGMVDSASKVGNTGAGFNGSVGMNRHFGHWDTSADFSYMQSVQTLYLMSTTSNYTYGGNLRRKFKSQTFLSLFYHSSRSGIVSQSGTGNESQSIGAALAWHGYSVSSNYNYSSGTGIISNTGTIISTPNGPLLTPDFVYFNARGLSVSGGKTYFRRLNVSGSYSKVHSQTEQTLGLSANGGTHYSFNTTYKLRKFAILGGYDHSDQTFSTLIGPPRVVNSYFVSLSRWFNIF